MDVFDLEAMGAGKAVQEEVKVRGPSEARMKQLLGSRWVGGSEYFVCLDTDSIPPNIHAGGTTYTGQAIIHKPSLPQPRSQVLPWTPAEFLRESSEPEDEGLSRG